MLSSVIPTYLNMNPYWIHAYLLTTWIWWFVVVFWCFSKINCHRKPLLLLLNVNSNLLGMTCDLRFCHSRNLIFLFLVTEFFLNISKKLCNTLRKYSLAHCKLHAIPFEIMGKFNIFYSKLKNMAKLKWGNKFSSFTYETVVNIIAKVGKRRRKRA